MICKFNVIGFTEEERNCSVVFNGKEKFVEFFISDEIEAQDSLEAYVNVRSKVNSNIKNGVYDNLSTDKNYTIGISYNNMEELEKLDKQEKDA